MKGYDYSSPGAYFITICTHQRECLFGEIVDGEMECSEFGAIVQDCWQQIPNHFPKIQLDASIVMPNHIHGILWIQDDGDAAGKGMAVPCPYTMPCPYKGEFGKPIAGSLSIVIGSFKSVTTKRINILRDASKISIWQRNYYEHIIRSEEALQHIRQYIQNNAIVWQQDQLHPDNPSKW